MFRNCTFSITLHNTKVVFSGSQSNALEFWGHIACGGCAAFIRTSFLTYPEWLSFKEIAEVSERTYLDFLFNIKDFYKNFSNTKEYLQGCLDETAVSNRKSVEYIIGNETEDLDIEILMDILYASFVKIHNPTDTEKRILEITGSRYKNFKNMNSYNCKTALQFLSNCGIATITYISDELKADPYIATKFLKNSNELYLKPHIYSKFNVMIDYPMFYIDLIQNVLKNIEINHSANELIENIVKCHVRTLLPKTGLFQYRSDNGMNIDYVLNAGYGIEISLSNKPSAGLNELPDDYKKIVLTNGMLQEIDGIQCIPYYQFIYDNSVKKNYE